MRRCTASANVSFSTRIGRDCPDPLGNFDEVGVLDEVRRPRRPADLAAHLDVLDRVGDALVVDVVQLPVGLLEQCLRASKKRLRHCGVLLGTVRVQRSTRPRSTGFVGSGGVSSRSTRHEQRQPLEVGPPALRVSGALVDVEEMIIEVEDPHIPVGHEVQLGRQRVGMRVGAQQRVVHRIELRLIPDLRRAVLGRGVEDPHLARPRLRVAARRSTLGFSRAGQPT